MYIYEPKNVVIIFFIYFFPYLLASFFKSIKPGPEVINIFFMLNSAEHEICPAHTC